MFDAWTPERPSWLRSIVVALSVWHAFLWMTAIQQSWHVQYGPWLWPQLIVGAAVSASALIALWRLNRVALVLASLSFGFELLAGLASGRANIVAAIAASLPLVAAVIIRRQLAYR